jgi:hypothetical protein
MILSYVNNVHYLIHLTVYIVRHVKIHLFDIIFIYQYIYIQYFIIITSFYLIINQHICSIINIFPIIFPILFPIIYTFYSAI